MLRTLEKLLSGVFFLGGLSQILPDGSSSILKLLSLGGSLVSSLLITEREYKTFHNQEIRKCWLRPVRILTPIIKTGVIITFIALEFFKNQSTEEQDNSYFLQFCYAGYAFSLLMDSRASWAIVRRQGESVDKWDSFLSLLTSGALISASVSLTQNLEAGPTIERISLIAAGSICLLQSPVRFKKEYLILKEELDPHKNIEGSSVVNLYQEPLLSNYN